MERLPFVLQDFTRLMWVSDAARDVWAPRVQQVTNAWLDIEWRAVVEGVRACAITFVTPERLVDQAAAWLDHGLLSLPLQMQGVTPSYAATPVAHAPGQPCVFRTVVGRARDVEAFRAAWLAADDERIGALLGYPPCCTSFFRRVWVNDSMVDTTWPMAAATAGITNGTREVTVTGPAPANILWRWMGVRAVPHLPCRTTCEPTRELGDRLLDVGRRSGYVEQMDWLEQMLSWPVEWSALHGIAEVKTPVLKVSTRTDATPVKYVVRREGTSYPAEGARGLGFPYEVPIRQRYTASPSFRRGLEQAVPVAVAVSRSRDYASDNGFSTVAAMDEAHAPIVAFASALLGGDRESVLDLGCGNGALLAKLRAAHPGIIPYGVDHDAARIGRGRTLLADYADNFSVGDIFAADAAWASRRYDLALLMPGRLLEADAARSARVRDWLRANCDRLLVYAYGDWLTRYGSLAGLVETAGLTLQQTSGPVGLAAIA